MLILIFCWFILMWRFGYWNQWKSEERKLGFGAKGRDHPEENCFDNELACKVLLSCLNLAG